MKYVIGEGIVFKVEEDNEIKVLDRTYIAINRYFIVPEDGEICGKEVHKGDLICTLYGERVPGFIIITDPEAKRLAQEEVESRQKSAKEPKVGCEEA